MLESIYSPQIYAFDKIFDNTSNTQTIFKTCCRDIIKSVVSGFNGSIFMYGQTTSGKTFTMLGSHDNPGILPCTLRDIFNIIEKDESITDYKIYGSYIEIYNESVYDLLDKTGNLKLLDDPRFGVVVMGAKKVRLKKFDDGIIIKDIGEENRKYRETLINEYSSRSHSIFQLFLETDFKENDTENSRISCLNLVDLAGSERINDYDNKNGMFSETGHINKSLFVLANVINKLAEGKGGYVPYRDSKLTRLLSQSLGGNALTSIICTVSPAAINYYQTLSTLRFATRAKLIKIKAEAYFKVNPKEELAFYKKEIMRLKNEIESSKIINYSENNFSGISKSLISEEMYKELKESKEKLYRDCETYKRLYQEEKSKNIALSKFSKDKSRSNNFNENENNFNNDITPSMSYLSGGEEHNLINMNKDNISLDSRKFGGENEISYIENILSKLENTKNPQDSIEGSLRSNFKEEKSIKIDTNNRFEKTKNSDYKTNSRSEKNSKFNISNKISNDEISKNSKNNNLNLKGFDDNIYKNFKLKETEKVIKTNQSIKNINWEHLINKNSIELQENGAVISDDIFGNCKFSFEYDNNQTFENNSKILRDKFETFIDQILYFLNYHLDILENHYKELIKKSLSFFVQNDSATDRPKILELVRDHEIKANLLKSMYDEKLSKSEKVSIDIN